MNPETATIQPLPPHLKYWTADEVAECLPYWSHCTSRDAAWALHNRLYSWLEACQNPTPVGGDGTNGTVETPYERLSLSNDDKAEHWWPVLTDDERDAITAAAADYFNLA